MWYNKMEEINHFRKEKTALKVCQACQLIEMYNNYKQVFSDKPGKVRNYQCN